MHKTLIFAAVWLLASCTSNHPILSDRAAVLPSEQARHVLQQCSREAPQSVEGVWTVSPAVVAQLERDLPTLSTLVSQNCCGRGSSVSNPATYYRQYAGVTIDGHNDVYINAFRDHPIYMHRSDEDRWRSEPVLVCDGGASFWGVLYDPETRQFTQLSFNGSA
jgi:uncharacterized protein (DUF779 family)